MSWESSLLTYYEKNQQKSGTEELFGRKKVPFVPVFHDTAIASYEVVLSKNGELLEVVDVPKNDAETIIPIYRGGRSSNVCPHALCDTVKYLSGEFGDKFYNDYMDKLRKWIESEFSHPTAKAVYSYLEKKTIFSDLAEHELKKKEKPPKEADIRKLVKPSSFVRFTVFQSDAAGNASHCWTDQTLHESFIHYKRSLGGEAGLDYLSGEEQVLSGCLPKGIRWSGDGTSLISANKDQYLNLVFTGLFQKKEEAFSIGEENAYKVINALKWAVRTTGGRYGDMAVAVWNQENLPVPDFGADTYTLSTSLCWETGCPDENPEKTEGQIEELSEDELDMDGDVEDVEETYFSEQQCIRMLDGYRKKIPLGTMMSLLAIDSATDQGRCSIVNYLELDGRILFENIEKWHSQGEWIHRKWVTDPDTHKRKKISFTGIPGIRDIANLVYGREITENGNTFIGFRETDKNKKLFQEKTAQKLIPCIWNNQPIPYDMVKKLTDKAAYPLNYQKRENWERVVSLACSFYKKYIFDKEGVVLDMALNKSNTDRSYLFGRYLAVADYAEKKTYKKSDDKRVTNAQRYMVQAVRKPAKTLAEIRLKIQPYLPKLSHYEREMVVNPLFYEISSLLDEESFAANEKLSPMFLLGYDSQMHELQKQRKKPEEEDVQEP